MKTVYTKFLTDPNIKLLLATFFLFSTVYGMQDTKDSADFDDRFEKIITIIHPLFGSAYTAIVTRYKERPIDFRPATQSVELTASDCYARVFCQGIDCAIMTSDGRRIKVNQDGTVLITERNR